MQKLSDFNFDLPERLIAQKPAQPRDTARLLHIHDAGVSHYHMRDLAALLKPGDLLVFNNSKVIKARLLGRRDAVRIDILLHKKISPQRWEAFARPLKRLREGQKIIFADDFFAHVACIRSDGFLELCFDGHETDFFKQLEAHGHMPLPPYIKRGQEKNADDESCYQTIYAGPQGSVAAPTAGLHFTPSLFETLAAKKISHTFITLHVGAGTFQPVKVDDISQHIMHAEYADINTDAAKKINATRTAGGRIVAVGTTATRTLETVSDAQGLVKAFQGETRIFIKPGTRFKCVDALITNFHLPQSTLFMLVCAFAGHARMHAAYKEAIAHDYRFYSYGDACFIENSRPLTIDS